MIKDIPGLSGYQADDVGNIYSRSGHKLRGSPTRKGYLRIAVCAPEAHYSATVHSLILKTFVGDRKPGMVARHLNGNPADNRLANLKWGTPSENERDKRRHGTAPKGERNGQAKLTAKQVMWIRSSAGKVSMRSMARFFSVSPRTIGFVMRGEHWGHVPDAAMAKENG